MIALREYVRRVYLRVERHELVSFANTGLVVSAINTARRQIQRNFEELYPERYSNRVFLLPVWSASVKDNQVVTPHGQTVSFWDMTAPADFIAPTNLYLHFASVLPPSLTRQSYSASEARYMTQWEAYTVSKHAFNYPTAQNPVYYTSRNPQTPTQWTITVGMAGGTLFNTFVELWYRRSVSAMDLSRTVGQLDNDFVTPPEAYDLVVLLASLEIARRANAVEAIGSLMAEIQSIEAFMPQAYGIRKYNEEINLPSKEGI